MLYVVDGIQVDKEAFDAINIDEIENALIMDGELSKKADAIIDKIYSNGAGDNISLILVNKL